MVKGVGVVVDLTQHAGGDAGGDGLHGGGVAGDGGEGAKVTMEVVDGFSGLRSCVSSVR